ncbi:ARF/SAR superfamily [Metschnikowia bicuspidata]|uniref:ARF/SAR superfamily n=1 Tax=Metschnikowia bicuspidata TaxID=27322 RepID=A0A4P9ZA14_9ASCO|nr:ARF/SAR superfamily [Metschnikowia bicuspidata]
MGLLQIIRKQKIKDQEIRILVLGLDNAGKTTVINSWMGRDLVNVAPTMGFQIHTFPWRGYSVNVWDVGGQSSLRAFWGNYFDKLDVVLWVIDAVSSLKLQELYQELRDKVIRKDQLKGTLFVVLVNKIDLLSAEKRLSVCDAVVDALRLEQELSATKYVVLPVLGRTGEGLEAAMDWIVDHMEL